MKNKKGFTLIELLAVIVILAIIALIATPIILNMIESARKSAAKDSAYGYIKAIEYETSLADLKGKKYEDKEDYTYNEIKVNIKGEAPTGGRYSLKNGVVTSGVFCINGYTVNYSDNTMTVGDKGCTGEDLKYEGKVVLSETQGDYTYPESRTFEVKENLSGGTLSCTTSDSSVATCSIEGNVVTVVPGTKEDSATITIISSATEKYKESKAAYLVKTAKGLLTINAYDYTGTYDGEEHSITLEVEDATIKYGTEEGKYTLTENPKYIDADTYIVYYQIEKEGYNTITGSKTVTINKAEGSVIAPTSKTLTYDGSVQELINAGSSTTGEIQYKLGENGTYSTNIPKASAIGTYTIYYKVIGDKNHNNVNEQSITVTIKGEQILEKAKKLVYKDGVCKTDGTTYNYMGGCYIKGASTNNYVWYNGFMWRIMGINSDNTVRLITDENVTAIPYGASNTAESYVTNEDYIHDWLNEYFLSHLNSTKSIIKEGNYFCSESTNSASLTDDTVRDKCTSGKEVSAKVGIISYDEYHLAGLSSSYLNIGQIFWTMTPYSTSRAWYVNFFGDAHYDVAYTYGVRPVINVEATSTITEGDGTTSSYYVLAEDKKSDKTGTIGNAVTSGEYVSLEGKTYRVVSKDTDGVKLIYDGYYDTNVAYGSYNTFTTTTGIGATLNGEVLTWLGLVDSTKIKETAWYQGTTMSSGYTYKTPLTETDGTGISAKVGLIRIGEMLSSQSSTILTNNYTTTSSYNNAKTYWTMTPYSTSGAWFVYTSGYAYNFGVASSYGVRPVIKLDTTLTISKGNGTWDNPYEI